MHLSCVLVAFAVCFVLVGTTRGQAWQQNGKAQTGKYTQTVGKGIKFRARLQKQMRTDTMPWTEKPCRDRSIRRCKRYLRMAGGTCFNGPRSKFDKRQIRLLRDVLRKRCEKSCKICTVKEQRSQHGIEKKTRVNVRHRKQPFPQVGAVGGGNRDTARRGIYYIFTKRIYL